MDENTNINVNSADAIFIPSDIIGEKSDYTSFKPDVIRTVPANCVLVKRNRFTGTIEVAAEKETEDEIDEKTGQITKYGKYKTGGWHFVCPYLKESIIIPIIDRTIDYPKASYYTEDGIETYVDIALKVRIVNPADYLKYGRYQLDQLNILTQNLLVNYVRSKEFKALSTGRINLIDFDPPTTKEINGQIITDQSAYEDFRKRYGIEIKSVQLKSVKPSEEVQKLMDDAAQAELRQKARQIELDTKKLEAEREAEIAEIRGKGTAKEYKLVEQAKIDILQQMYSVLTDSNMSNSQKVNVLQQMIAGKNGTYIHLGGSNGDSNGVEQSISRGILAGNIASDKIRQNQNNNSNNIKITNCEKIIQELEALIATGLIEKNEEVDNLINLLTNDSKVKEYVNKLDEQQYRIFADNTLSSYKKTDPAIKSKH